MVDKERSATKWWQRREWRTWRLSRMLTFREPEKKEGKKECLMESFLLPLAEGRRCCRCLHIDYLHSPRIGEKKKKRVTIPSCDNASCFKQTSCFHAVTSRASIFSYSPPGPQEPRPFPPGWPVHRRRRRRSPLCPSRARPGRSAATIASAGC